MTAPGAGAASLGIAPLPTDSGPTDAGGIDYASGLFDSGVGSLADVLPSVLASLEVADTPNPLGFSAAVRRACVLLIDGLGAVQLRENAHLAPFLSSLPTSAPLLAGYPATTATSLASLGIGVLPGVHGILGYQVALPGGDEVLNAIHWDDRVDPYAYQPLPTMFERAGDAGIDVVRVGPEKHADSGLTIAVQRGGRFIGVDDPDDRFTAAAAALAGGDRTLVYLYFGDLDSIGHACGVNSDQWRATLVQIDRLAARLAGSLPPGAGLWITADHGMVDVPREGIIDIAAHPELSAGVHLLGGAEARTRYLYCDVDAVDDVLDAWRGFFGDRADVRSREEAIEAGWFGPRVLDRSLPRIGDVLIVPREIFAVVDSRRDNAGLLELIGMHGALTEAELSIPLLEVLR